jgi:hypothetical protein
MPLAGSMFPIHGIIAAFANHIGLSRIILGGHDRGGTV